MNRAAIGWGPFALGLLLAGCGGSVPAAVEASIENARAAVVVFEGDRFDADDQLQAIQDISVADRESLSEDFNARSVSVKTQGGPADAFYAQFIFQTAVDTADRQVLESRVLALGLEAPIWLGPDDLWPFCAEQPCELVRDDGDYP